MKISAFLITLALLLSLCGCGARNIDGGGNAFETAPADETETAMTEAPTTAEDENEPVASSDDDGDNGLTPIYDDSAVVEAYRNGDESSLDERQKTVLESAVAAVGEFYRDGMSDEEIAIAAHDWITTHITYDTKMLGLVKSQTPDTENPYGVFTTKMGICMGYTTTFQLFMDMLGVESMIVRGEALDEEHAWNLVNLDGEWYHVDCTWDDFLPDDDPERPAFHLYVFVPDVAMEVQHVWNHDDYPAATSEDRIYLKTHGLFAETPHDCSEMLHLMKDGGALYAEIMASSADGFAYNGSGVTYWPTDMGDYFVGVFWLDGRGLDG